MDIKQVNYMIPKYFLYILFGFVLAGMFTSCIKKKCSRDIVFEGQVTISPWLDTFSVGDTFSIRIFFDDPVSDIHTGEVFAVDEHEYPTILLISRIDTYPEIYANLDFLPKPIMGNLLYKPSSPSISEHTAGEPGSYIVVFEKNEFRVQFTALKKGMYWFSVWSQRDKYEPSNLISDCRDYLEVWYKFENGDAYENNFEMLQDAPWEGYQNISSEVFVDKYARYVFVVKE